MKRFDFWTVVMIITWVLLLILLLRSSPSARC
jgi:hypothetical protein